MPTHSRRFIEDLSAWVSAKEAKPRQDVHVVAFLAVRSDVTDALAAGYSMRTIWSYLTEKGRIQCRYETFTVHVGKFIRTPATIEVPAAPTTMQSRPVASPAPSSQIGGQAKQESTGITQQAKQHLPGPGSQSPGPGAFNFDATPNKEDLI